MKFVKNGTIILIVGLIGLLVVIGVEISLHAASKKPPRGDTPQEIAAMEIEPININTASVTELNTLPGLSKNQAQNIVDHRDQNGTFRSVEELLTVKGIGKEAYQMIALYITAE